MRSVLNSFSVSSCLAFVSFKVLNFGNSLTLIVINMIYFANIFPLSVKDNVHIGSVAHIYIYIYIFIYLYSFTFDFIVR
jgi:hypothetical protein